jgi:hypothetical protein
MAMVQFGCASTIPVAAPTDGPTESEPVELSTTSDTTLEAPAEHCENTQDFQEQTTQSNCDDDAAAKEALLDRAQRTVFGVANNTTRWFDGFFAETPLNDADHVSRGRLTPSVYWDQRDNFSTRVRFRGRFALPGLEQRTRLILGRGDVDDMIDGTDETSVEGLPGSFDTDRDDDWLIGLGYSRSGNPRRGFDLGVGVRFATPLEPYVRLTYRWNKTFRDTWLFNIRPRAFWQSQRGTGMTLQTDVGHVFSPEFVVRWANDFAVEDEVRGLGWRSDLLAYHGLSNNKAFSYGIFALGETDAAVPVQNYGFELRYRQRLYREWFFVQLSGGVSWPRLLIEEVRESNLGVGIMFEMRFGQW